MTQKRLHGIAAYREITLAFAAGDRLQFTVSKPELDIKNRDLETVERIEGNNMSVRLDDEKVRTLTFDVSQMRHFDHGYAVTSLSAQGLTTDRVLINMGTASHSELIKFLLGHCSIQTTERYLGSDQEIVVAVNDNLGL
jgi:ATP-dependent exoDNAse (exonuclease V) alpha subunit